MRRFGRILGRMVLALVVVGVVLLSPVVYVETMCQSPAAPRAHAALLPEADHRAESRTLLTYPEWHIVHAYEDYAEVIRTNDPHDFGYLQAIAGFWSSLCALSEQAGPLGGTDGATRQMVYTIGVSFTFELAMKAAYEETLGRLATMVRGQTRAPLDDLSARQAAAYATFLQQVPWYRWDFATDGADLRAASTGRFRDRERALALGLEAAAKSAYAGVIAAAVAGLPPDALTLRLVVTGLTEDQLARVDGVRVIGPLGPGIQIESPRYRAFTTLARALADRGGNFAEIAGNDDILFTALTDTPPPGTLHSFARQGHGGARHLVLVRVADLAARLRDLGPGVEHIHDY